MRIFPRHKSERGQALVLFALGLTVFLGLVGISIDVGHLAWARTDQQKAADAALLAAIEVHLETGNVATAKNAALAYAADNGYAASLVTVNNPPSSGPSAGNAGAWEVIIAKDLDKYFIGALYGGAWKAQARAVGHVYEEATGFGVITLHPTACNSLIVNGTLNVDNGGVFVNSSCEPNALYVGTGGVVTSDLTHVTGNYTNGSGATLDPDPKIHQPPVPDPFATVPTPPITTTAPATQPVASNGAAAPSCNSASQSVSYANSNWTFYPGRYNCHVHIGGGNLGSVTATFMPGNYAFVGGLTLTQGSTARLGRGIYVTMGSGLELTANTTLKDDPSSPKGVLLYNTCVNTCGNAGTIDINSTATIDLTYYGDPYKNLLIWQNRNAPQTISFNADSFTSPGAIYAKSGHLSFSADTSVPLQFVSSTAAISASATIDVDVIGATTAQVKFTRLLE